ncbi:MAG: hypothetical protein M0Z82_12980 [Actinomycetota bacterium]|jgi:hypothetical protein|nr:hypothetical protein [Actinomycetota bacterium]MDA8072477.1 hypothetical protein [Actinomycetota bacterium]
MSAEPSEVAKVLTAQHRQVKTVMAKALSAPKQDRHKELPAVAGHLDARQEGEMVAALSQVAALASHANGQLRNGDPFAAMLQANRDHFERSSSATFAARAERNCRSKSTIHH